MSWWRYPVQWLGKKETRIGPTGDGRLLRIFMRSMGRKSVVTRVDVQCSNCGDWITDAEEGVIIKDSMGSTRNEHKQCKAVA